MFLRSLPIILFFTFFSYASATELKHVSLQLQWYHQFEFAGFYVAKEKGFYKEVGLDVDFLEYDPNYDIIDNVLEKKATFGVVYSTLFAAYANDRPVVLLANFLKQSPYVLMTQKEITSLDQLKGKTVEGNLLESKMILDILLQFSDISLHDLKMIAPKPTLDDFITKKIDARFVYLSNEPYMLDQNHIGYNLYSPALFGMEFYDLNLFTSKDAVKKDPQMVVAFQKASIKGWQYALDHKEEAAELIFQKYNTAHKSKKALLYEAKVLERLMMPHLYALGSVDLARVRKIIDTFKEYGKVDASKEVDLSSLLFDPEKSLDITGKIFFSKDEQRYLQNKKTISMCVDPNWMPLEGIVDGKYAGLDSDFVKIFEQKINHPISLYPTRSWSETLQKAQEGKCDIVSMVVHNKEREGYLRFTKPYLSLPLVIAGNKESESVLSAHLLKTKKIGVVKGYAWADILRDKYPETRLVLVENMREGIEKVIQGELYGILDTPLAIDYYTKGKSAELLKTIAILDEKVELRVGVKKDDALLFSIMDKVVRSIDEVKKMELYRKWQFQKYEPSEDYKNLKIFLFVLIGIMALFMVRYVQQKKGKEKFAAKLQEELSKSRKKDNIIYEKQKLAAMGEMIDNIAHQWRQPLMQVNSAVSVIDAQLSQNGIDDQEIDKKLNEIEELTQYMSNTIDDFRHYLSPHQELEEYTICAMIERCETLLQDLIVKNNVKIVKDGDKDVTCNGYPRELLQVLMILLQNALEALVGRGIVNGKISIKTEQKNDEIILSVSDNAGGVNKEYIEKIWEPYFTTKQTAQGSGLGLYVAHKLVQEKLRGKLHVENQANGACFTLRFQKRL